MCYAHASFILYDVDGTSAHEEKDGVESIFERVYTEAVRNKMLQNNIDLNEDFEPNMDIMVPRCVKKGYMKRFMREYVVARNEYDEENNTFMNADYDATDEEIRHAFGFKSDA